MLSRYYYTIDRFVYRSLETILSDLNGESNVSHSFDGTNAESSVDDKKTVGQGGRKSTRKTHRDGIRMNLTALKREMHNKEKLQKQQNQSEDAKRWFYQQIILGVYIFNRLIFFCDGILSVAWLTRIMLGGKQFFHKTQPTTTYDFLFVPP